MLKSNKLRESGFQIVIEHVYREIIDQWQKMSHPIKKSKLIIVAISLVILGDCRAVAQTSDSPTDNPELISRRMFVDPSSTSVSLGKARLIVSPLSETKGAYIGGYQLKVRPYFFKSQEGALVMIASEDLIRKLCRGLPVEFVGKATNKANGEIKIVKGKAIPSNGNQGAVTFSLLTDNGEMVFNTSYHFAK